MSTKQSALELWKEKLNEFQRNEAVASDYNVKFQLKKEIEECKQKIQELERNEEKTEKPLPVSNKTTLKSEPKISDSIGQRESSFKIKIKQLFHNLKGRRQLKRWLGFGSITIGASLFMIWGLSEFETPQETIKDDDFLKEHWLQKNPNSFDNREHREVAIETKEQGIFAEANLYKEKTYDPDSQGSISSIEFSYNFILKEITGGYGQLGTMFLLEQNGVLFIIKPPLGWLAWGVHPPNTFAPSGPKYFPQLLREQGARWIGWSCKGLTRDDFMPLSEYAHEKWGQPSKQESGMKPDFSANGGVIYFGYLTARSAHEFKATYGIDNWKVKINSKTTRISGLLHRPSCFPNTSDPNWRATFTEEDLRNSR